MLHDAVQSPRTADLLPGGGGGTGALVRAFDWSSTPLGPIASWPESLRTATALILQSPVPMVMLWGEDGVMIYNESYSVFAGGRHPHLLGSKVREGWPEVADFNDHVMKVVLAGGTLAYRDQELSLNRSGRSEQVWMNLDYSPVPDESGRPAGVLAIVIETTERVLAERRQRAAEAATRESEARLRDVLDNSGEAFILLDRDFRVVDINAEGLKLEGRPRDQIVGKSHWEAWPGTEDSELGRRYRHAMSKRESVYLEHRYRWPDGQEAWLEVRAYPVSDGLALFYRDVSEKRRAADAAREAAERIELALNSGAILGTWVWDVAEDRLVGDERFAHTFGLGAEVCGEGVPLASAVESIHPDDHESVMRLVEAALACGGPYRAEYRVRYGEGDWRWVEANGRVELGPDGAAQRFPGVIVDVDERRRAEEALRQSEARLRVAQAAGGVGTFELMPETGRILVSEEFCRIWGVPPVAETDVAEFLKLIHPHDQARVQTGARTLTPDVLDPVEYRIIRPDTGELRWLARRGEAVRDESGATRWLGVCFDITDRKTAEEALREREGQLSAFVNQATAGFAQVDLSGRFTLVNDRFCEIAGRSREDLYARTMQSITHPDDLPANVPKFERAVAAGTPFTHEKRYVRPDGSIVWVNNSVSVIRRPSGEPYGVLAVSIDVTERRNAEAAVRENEARLRALTDNLPAGMVYQVVTGPEPSERRFLFVSQSCEKLTGHPAEAIVADASVAYGMIEPEDLPRLAAAEEEAISGRRPFDVQARIRRADGQLRWARIISAPREGPDGTLIWDGIKIDITDQKEAEALLRDLNATLEQRVAERTAERDRAWKATQDLLVTVDAHGVLRAVNPAWTRVLGYSEAETVGRDFSVFIHPDDEAATRRAVATATNGVLDRFVNRYLHKDGSVRWISWSAAPEGQLVYASGRDISAEKEAAEELAIAQEALRQSQKMEAMGQLTGGVAHDFNNLLTPIIGALDLLTRKGIGGDRERRLVDGALQSAERAKTLVQRLLAFARRQPLQAGAVDVPELIAGMADLVQSTSGPQIRIVTEVASDLPFARADANQLELAILNLAVNARDAMPEGGAITIRAAAAPLEDVPGALKPGQYIRVAVVDTGLGMDEETLARAVEPFFSTKGVGHGTGLGLSMVHGLAAQLGGALMLSSGPGEGTVAELWLPVASGNPAPEAEAQGADSADSLAAGTVLLVDDEPLVRASAADMLLELGYRVIEADSGGQALKLLETQAVDLVITDHLMPGLSGTDLARALAARPEPIPVLVVSGYADLEGLPADLPRLTKPFRQSDLYRSIRALRSETGGAASGGR